MVVRIPSRRELKPLWEDSGERYVFDRPFLLLHDCLRREPRRSAAVLPHLPRRLIRRVARARLLGLLQHVWRHSEAQRQRWQQAGIRRRDLHSLAVLPRIPFTTGADLALRGDGERE